MRAPYFCISSGYFASTSLLSSAVMLAMPWRKIAEESVSGCSWASQMRLMAPFDQPIAFTFSSFRCARRARKSARTAARPRSESSRTGPEPPIPRGSK